MRLLPLHIGYNRCQGRAWLKYNKVIDYCTRWVSVQLTAQAGCWGIGNAQVLSVYAQIPQHRWGPAETEAYLVVKAKDVGRELVGRRIISPDRYVLGVEKSS